MRGVLVAAILVLAGCAGSGPTATERPVQPADIGFSPSLLEVTGHRIHNATIRSFDGFTDLAALIYEPLGNRTDAPGTPVAWPLVIFVHGWGGNKESYTAQQAFPVATGMEDPRGDVDRLAEFANAGFIALAYDARGYGDSEGYATVAGPKEMADLDAVITWAERHFETNGKVGVLGGSYGGGHALLAWTDNPRVTTAASFYGWTDLAQSLIPNDVPKLEWANFLYAYGRAGTGRYDPMIDRWYQSLYTREDFEQVRAEMEVRSAEPRMSGVAKPLYLCQGIEETLFPQIDRAWNAAGGFTRATTYTGGHGQAPQECWQRALDWFRFFLAGYDTRVDAWPALETMDAGGTGPFAYAEFPQVSSAEWRLRDGEMYQGDATTTQFRVRQYLLANPLDAPQAFWDQAGMPNPAVPEAVRQDPSGESFTTAPFDHDTTLLGAARLELNVVGGEGPYQVAATLYHITAAGDSRAIGHAAAANLTAGAAQGSTLAMDFTWTHARISAGDRLQVKLNANDASWWVPLLADYDMAFDGHSVLRLPLT